MRLSVCVVVLCMIPLVVCHDGHSDKEEEEEDAHRPVTLRQSVDETQLLLPEGKLPIILYWYDHIFPHSSEEEIHCKLGDCYIAKDRKHFKDPATRAFIFYGTSFLASDLPLPREPQHLWSLFHEESPKNNWLLSHERGISVFNYTATFRRESDYPLATHYISKPEIWLKPKHFVSTAEKNRLQAEEGLASVVYVQRGCRTSSDRSTYIKELMKYIKVDSYGPCLNNKKMPEEYDGFVKLHNDGFYKFMAQYKFHLAFENAICRDYMTEKLFRPLEVGSVPIYRGSSKAKEFMPTNRSLIMVDDFESPMDLANFIKKLNKNDEEYNKYLKHMQEGITNDKLWEHLDQRHWHVRSEYERVNAGHLMFAKYECFLCDKLYERNEQIKQHLKDPVDNPMPKPSIASRDHLGCPKPVKSLPQGKELRSTYDEGLKEAEALQVMLKAKETDSSTFVEKYLHANTDKYPKAWKN